MATYDGCTRPWRAIWTRARTNDGLGIWPRPQTPLTSLSPRLLESAADAALSRSDVSAAVAGFEQAAILSPQRSDRGRRLLGAGAAASQLGQGDELLRQALADTDDPAHRTDIVLLRARSAIERGDQALVARLARDESDAVA